MKKQLGTLMMAALLAIPAAGFAMKHMDHSSMPGMDHSQEMVKEKSKKMDQGSMSGMDHGSMAMDGKMIMLQNVEVEGVTASGGLIDNKEKMAAHGIAMTHHLMVGFKNTAGEEVEKGQVAVKVESPDGKVSEAIHMMGMAGQFGADLNLDQSGMYQFKIGTKLADGTKRMYQMQYENK